MDDVVIAGIGIARGDGEVSHAELLFSATRAAYDDAGIDRADVTSAVTTSYDFVEGRVLSNQFTLDSIGGTMKSCDLRLGDTGLHGLAAGVSEALADPGGMVVVASVLLDATDGRISARGVEELSYEPLFLRPIIAGATYPEALMFGLIARAYLGRHSIADEELAGVVSRDSALGSADQRTSSEILDSNVVAGPLRVRHMAPRADVAVALMLTCRPSARRRAVVRGIGWSAVGASPDQRDLARQEATEQASRRAYSSAGLHDPRAVARAEVTNAYGIDGILAVEALGLADPGHGIELLRESGGGPAVNPTGGVQGVGWARGTSSLAQLAAAVAELSDEGANGELLLGQTWGGLAGSTAAVAVVEVAA